MKILFTSWEFPPNIIGGLGKHVYHLASQLVQDGHDIVVVTRHPTGTNEVNNPTKLVNHSGIKVIYTSEDPHLFSFSDDITSWVLAMQHSMLRESLKVLNGELPEWKPEVIHAHDWLVGETGIFFSEYYNVPLVTTIHATEAGRHNGWLSKPLNQQIHALEWWLCQKSDNIITCSQSMAQEVHTLFAVDSQKINIIHNGIDVKNSWTYQPAYNNKQVLVYVGRLEYEKGIQDLIEIIPKLQEKYPKIRLTIVGSGTQYTALVSQVKDLGLTDSVVFTGNVHTNEVENLLKAANLAVLPSIYEPFGLVALESAAVGTPIVAAKTGGLAEVIQNEVTGLTFPPRNKKYMFDAIDLSLQDPLSAKKRAKTARKKIEKDFTWELAAQKTSLVYQQTTKNKNIPLTKPHIGELPLL